MVGKGEFDISAPESSPVIRGINAYLFLVKPASLVALDGRVLTSDGRGLGNATVSITDSQGVG